MPSEHSICARSFEGGLLKCKLGGWPAPFEVVTIPRGSQPRHVKRAAYTERGERLVAQLGADHSAGARACRACPIQLSNSGLVPSWKLGSVQKKLRGVCPSKPGLEYSPLRDSHPCRLPEPSAARVHHSATPNLSFLLPSSQGFPLSKSRKEQDWPQQLPCARCLGVYLGVERETF